jgi:hypothetical protein
MRSSRGQSTKDFKKRFADNATWRSNDRQVFNLNCFVLTNFLSALDVTIHRWAALNLIAKYPFTIHFFTDDNKRMITISCATANEAMQEKSCPLCFQLIESDLNCLCSLCRFRNAHHDQKQTSFVFRQATRKFLRYSPCQ